MGSLLRLGRGAALVAASLAAAASTPHDWKPELPFSQVAPGTAYIVFYRIAAERQFLFVYHLPEKRLVAFEVDRREAEGEDEQGGEEATEVVHHLPIARYAGTIQYLALPRLPESAKALLRLTRQKQLVIGEDRLEARPALSGSYLALAPPPAP